MKTINDLTVKFSLVVLLILQLFQGCEHKRIEKNQIRIEAKLDTVLTIYANTSHEINTQKIRLDSVYAHLSDSELLQRAKAINEGYRNDKRK